MLNVVNPATEEVIDRLEEDAAVSIRQKFEGARVAQNAWADTPLKDRLDCIRRFGALLKERQESLAKLLTLEVGKPITQSNNELNGMQPRIEFFLQNTAKAIGQEKVLDDAAQKMEERIEHEPLGVIANISAWNYPYYVSSNVFLPALLTGNAVLYKPSEFAALTGIALRNLLHESGIPKDVFVTVIGGGQAGAELLRLPVNGVFFTGSYATGGKIAEAVAGRMIKLQLELGGKDPIYVCEDVDAKAAAEATADGAFYNTGQSCCSVERIYVHEALYPKFVESFRAVVASFALGDPLQPQTYIGPLTRNSQRDVLERQVADAVAKGATLLCGGKRGAGRGYYFEPTVLANVTSAMEVMREESFGPIIGLQEVSGDAEAVALMNDTPYGLTAGVYTKDRDRASRILNRVNAGTVYWNCCDRVSPRLPWSGRGHSGVGLTLSLDGIRAFTQPKAWHLRTP